MRTNIQNLPLLAEYRGINNEIKEFNVEPPIYILKSCLFTSLFFNNISRQVAVATRIRKIIMFISKFLIKVQIVLKHIHK